MRISLSGNSPWRKVLAAVAIAIISTCVGIAFPQSSPGQRIGEVFYDWFYTQRPVEDRTASSTVLIKVDDYSLKFLSKGDSKGENAFGWPWPRDIWGMMIDYFQKVGAKCVVFDLLFNDKSVYAGELDDDAQFGAAIDKATIPIIMAAFYDSSGKPGPFYPVVKKPPRFGAVNAEDVAVVQSYDPVVMGNPSLALAAVQAVGGAVPDWALHPFLMHYYGPDSGQKNIAFNSIPAATVLNLILNPKLPHDIGPQTFQGKIVVIGITAAGGHDEKSAPYGLFPGMELHATAIENMLFKQRVVPIESGSLMGFVGLISVAGTAGSIFPRKVWLKFAYGLPSLVVVVVLSRFLFLQDSIRWLDPSGPLLAAVCAIVLSLGWSYFAEDVQARFFLKALGQYLSPHVAAELRGDPNKLSLSTESRELTILFSDIVDFTPLSERLGNDIGKLLNFYLGEMSEPVLASDGTLDKYIGDAVMAFWNAPLRQENHGERACRAALAMKRRLAEIRPQLAELGAPNLDCRVGLNSGVVTFGNMGSAKKFNYSVIGDAVNFASRLEGANKFYGTGIMIGEATAESVRGRFFARKLDLLRVKGKTQPVVVYELICEGAPEAAVRKMAEQYESAFESYQRRDWSTAEKNLLELLQQFPDDGPAKMLVKRIGEFAAEAPPANWDGVYVAKSK